MKWLYIIAILGLILLAGGVIEQYQDRGERQSIHLGAQP